MQSNPFFLLLASPSKISIYTDSWLTVYFPWTLMFWKYFFFFNCKYGWNKHMVETTLRLKLVTLEKTEEKFCHLCTIKNWKLASTQWQKKHLQARCNPIFLFYFVFNFTKKPYRDVNTYPEQKCLLPYFTAFEPFSGSKKKSTFQVRRWLPNCGCRSTGQSQTNNTRFGVQDPNVVGGVWSCSCPSWGPPKLFKVSRFWVLAANRCLHLDS